MAYNKKEIDKKADSQFFEDALVTLKKTYGAAFDTRGISEDSSYEGIPTGHDDLDVMLTNRSKGIYLGGICEIFGSPHGGKTSLAMRTVGNAQKMGHQCLWVDAETGFSEDLAALNGIDLESLIKPDLAELKSKSGSPFLTAGELLDMVYDSVMAGIFGLIVVDSVAGLMPRRILDPDFDPNKPGVAEVARILSEQLSRLHIACVKTKTTVIFINQLRLKPGDIWNPETTPGGWALPFYADQRIRVDKVMGQKGDIFLTYIDPDDNEESERLIGHYARVRIVKNRKAPPVRDPIEICIYYEHYFPDNAKKCYDIARELKVIKLHKSTLTWKDGDEIVLKHEGESEMLAAIRDKKMETYLATCCVKAEKEESNQKLKEPVRVPASIKEIASKYNKETPVEEKKTEETKKRGKGKVTPAISLDE